MTIKENLHRIFNADYPGIKQFISEVVRPVFGDNISYVGSDLYEVPEYQRRADSAGITKLMYVADIIDEKENANNIVLLDVTLSGRVLIERARVNIQALIRSIVQTYTHILIVFHYQDTKDKAWRLSYAYKESSKADTTPPKRFTYVFGKDYNGWTAAERFGVLAASERTDADFVNAFSVEALSNEFFDRYREIYADFVQEITGSRYEKTNGKWEEHQLKNPDPQFYSTFEGDKKMVRDYIKKMFGRIVFLYFLQRKGWLNGNLNYMRDLWAKSDLKGNFLDGVLEPLFFEVLNTEKHKRSAEAKALPGCDNIPYLNGGLFAQEEIDIRTCVFPRRLFQRLFDFLDSYNFTIDENDSEDTEIGIDPEMLGRIFESLLEDNKDKGAYYTPKFIVDYMCREAIISYLCNGYVKEAHPLIREFVETLNADVLNHDQQVKIAKKLLDVKICDPAIGSGAFPMGMVNLLSKLYIAMKATTDTTTMKRHIMEKNIYGVDIEKGAVDIARLRFWLAMIVDETEQRPLPNLNFKIMQGNSLLESYRGRDFTNLVYGKDGGYDFYAEERKLLQKDIQSYYRNSDHTKSGPQLHHIKNQIRNRIYDNFALTLPADEDGGDPSANEHFFLWHTWFSEVFDNGGFDIVIGNPPYVRLQLNGGAIGKPYEVSNFKTFDKTGDLYCLFYEMGMNLLREHGVLCFITSNKWMKTGYGRKLRNFFINYTNPKILIDFGSVKIFDSASVDTNIILLGNEPNKGATICVDANGHERKEVKNLTEFINANGINCKFDNDRSWNITSPIESKIKAKIEAIGKPLKDWNVDIYLGIKTGYNQAFVISSERRKEILRACNSEDERIRTQKLIQPLLRGRDISNCTFSWNDWWLINTHNGVKGKFARIDIDDYPSIKSHLTQFWDKISTRADKGDTPYNLRNCAYIEALYKPKLIYPDISQGMSFVLDTEGYVVNNTMYFMSGLDEKRFSWLATVLNSKLYNWYYKTISAQLGGAAIRMLTIYVMAIPVPDCYPNTDLYSIFGLTPEEIAFIEGRD